MTTTLQQFAKQWEILLLSQQRQPRLPPWPPHATEDTAVDTTTGTVAEEECQDPSLLSNRFNCTSLEIPPFETLIDQHAHRFVQEWKALDERKILVVQHPLSSLPTLSEGTNDYWNRKKRKQVTLTPTPKPTPTPNIHLHRRVGGARVHPDSGLPLWYDHPNRIRLPPHFDYLTRQSVVPPDDNDDENPQHIQDNANDHSNNDKAASETDSTTAITTTTTTAAASANDSAPAGTSPLRSLPQQQQQQQHHHHNYRVVSLVDPMRTTSYHSELWNLFARIPTVDHIETQATTTDTTTTSAVAFPRMKAWLQKQKQQQRQQRQPQPQEKKDDQSQTRRTSYAMNHNSDKMIVLAGEARLRLSDRHDAPPFITNSSSSFTTTTNTTAVSSSSSSSSSGASYRTTIRFECWRGAQGPSSPSVLPDPNRMSVELCGSDTLYTVHQLIVEMTDDELWTTATDPTHNHDNDDDGFFWIEDTFYSTGGESERGRTTATTTYVRPIVEWLHRGSVLEQTRRREWFGLESSSRNKQPHAQHRQQERQPQQQQKKDRDPYDDDDDLDDDLDEETSSSFGWNVKDMSETRLDTLKLRLGVRYVHVHHGNLECSLYCVDRRLVLLRNRVDDIRDENHHHHHHHPTAPTFVSPAAAQPLPLPRMKPPPMTTLTPPILHDVWTHAYPPPPSCDACQHRTTMWVTSPTCRHTLGGPRMLCHACAQLLQIPPNQMEKYSVYYNDQGTLP